MSEFSSRPRFPIEPGRVDVPSWVADTVFYQIFPDRFAKSGRLPKPAGIEPWETDPTTFGYKGGDLLGVLEHLDYIQNLGVNAIYLNPIFQSASNHRYHTHDYFHVDPLLGGDAAFDELLEACHQRGIRVVLDGVFNHASRGFFQFNDVLENGESSPWRDWFVFTSFPPNAYDHEQPAGYQAWFDLHALPKFNTDNPEVREFIMQIGEYWLRKGIDGWRLDVPHEITTPGFWQEFRQRMRAIDPECYITGEIWDLATEFLQGDQFDSVMNYRYAEAVLAFVGRSRIVREHQEDRGYDPWPGIDGSTYANRIDHLLGAYDWHVTNAMMNLIDSHDTPRALTLMSDDVRSLELAYLLLLTYPGAPSIYYGSEIGLDGGMPDRWARKPFPWDQPERWNMDLLSRVKTLIALRHDHPVLRTGSYQAVVVSETSYAFIRKNDNERLLVIVNTGDVPDSLNLQMSDSAELLTMIGDESVEFTAGAVIVPARSGGVWSLDLG